MTSAPGGATSAAAPRPIRLVILLGAVLAVMAIALAAGSRLGGPSRQVESGIVIAVRATSLIDVQGFSIRTADGRTLDFQLGALENAATFPPGHLAEHKVSLALVRVTFLDRGGARVVVRIEDGP